MKFYWVNVGKSYNEVVSGNFLWAPQFGVYPIDEKDASKGTRSVYFDYWTNVGEVKAGDIIFGNVDRRIMFVAVAKKDSSPALRPPTRTFNKWNNLGFRVDIQMFPLDAFLPIDGEVKEAFDRRYNKLSSPMIFKKNNDVFQGYMAAIPDAAGVEILRLVGDVEVEAIEASESLRSSGFGSSSTGRKRSGPTTKQAVHDARIGQGQFRKDLLNMWGACPITKISNTDLLLASHTKPWSKSNDIERLDPYNGFLFAPHIDRPFDKGLISFDDNGKIIISNLLSLSDQVALGIDPAISINLHPNHKKYLAAHRSLFGL